MGLTKQSTGSCAVDHELVIAKTGPNDRVIALAGNPNVGKSTVFNALTGLNQHTGNWPGKTVTNAKGEYTYKDGRFLLVDIPGTYSLMANSAEEEVARDFICFGNPDAVIVVADATCLERNLNLALQILEITPNVILCVNLLDEAQKKKITVDLPALSSLLHIPVVGASARSGKGLKELCQKVYELTFSPTSLPPYGLRYDSLLETAIGMVEPALVPYLTKPISSRWIAVKLLDLSSSLHSALTAYLGVDLLQQEPVAQALSAALAFLQRNGVEQSYIRDGIVSKIVETAERISSQAVHFQNAGYHLRDRKLDRILTSKATGIPIMLLLLGLIFYLTMVGANYPSSVLSALLFGLEEQLSRLFVSFGAPAWLRGLLVEGMYRTLAWVVSVMLPPMAIFFPLFTLLEDLGYLPRVAFNMDKFFRRAGAHGKQSLSMCMGFGCNACGVIGCRIIDSPRERLIAILTNNFVPCNGRFPTILSLITIFFAVSTVGGSLLSALLLTGVILLGIFMTLLVSRLLSHTVLKGVPSSFALELPPYRVPQVGKVIVRSIFDRTLFVLGRAAAVAAPAGLVIYLMGNVTVGGVTLLTHCASFLDPFARFIGLDGVILIAFILGFPANEIVLPIIIMAYLSSGSMMELESLSALKSLLLSNGWTPVTAACTILFSLFHFPCGTTCWTIAKETKSVKWTLLAIVLPTAVGIILCAVVANAARLLL